MDFTKISCTERKMYKELKKYKNNVRAKNKANFCVTSSIISHHNVLSLKYHFPNDNNFCMQFL